MKKLITIVICIILVAAALVAQTAKVIHLKTEDQVQAKKLYNELQAAQKAWTTFNEKINKDYLHPEKEVWFNGFEFSEDFTVIVPRTSGQNVLHATGGSLTVKPKYPYSYFDGCNTTTCTAPGVCSSTLAWCGGK